MQSISEVENVADVAGSDESPDRSHNAFLWTLAGLLVAGLWLPSLVSSLWVDEAGTWWVIADGVHQVVQRAEAVQGQSPLFYLLLWSWVHLAGHSEVALRLPSVVSSLASAWFVYLIAKRFFDKEVGRLAVIAFVAWNLVAFEASNARPYALGTLLVTGAAWALIAWLDRGGIRRAIVFVLLAALVPYVHPFLALIFFPYAIYAVLRARDGSAAVSAKSLVAAAVSIVVLVAPICVQLIALARRRDELSTSQTVSMSLILTMLIPTALIATALFILLLSARVPIRFTPSAVSTPTKYLLISWLLIPAGAVDPGGGSYLAAVAAAALLRNDRARRRHHHRLPHPLDRSSLDASRGRHGVGDPVGARLGCHLQDGRYARRNGPREIPRRRPDHDPAHVRVPRVVASALLSRPCPG